MKNISIYRLYLVLSMMVASLSHFLSYIHPLFLSFFLVYLSFLSLIISYLSFFFVSFLLLFSPSLYLLFLLCFHVNFFPLLFFLSPLFCHFLSFLSTSSFFDHIHLAFLQVNNLFGCPAMSGVFRLPWLLNNCWAGVPNSRNYRWILPVQCFSLN